MYESGIHILIMCINALYTLLCEHYTIQYHTTQHSIINTIYTRDMREIFRIHRKQIPIIRMSGVGTRKSSAGTRKMSGVRTRNFK